MKNQSKISLADRMKHNYEEVSKYRLVRRIPVILRLDGKAFHTYTKGLNKPFDSKMGLAMQITMAYLCANIQGCVFGYTQSDEISLVLIDYKRLESEAWFDFEVQKMSSIAASIASVAFNSCKVQPNKAAYFDCRCFNIPKEEVSNYFIWRQQDATRNSKQALGYANIPVKTLQGMNTDEVIKKVAEEKGIVWSRDIPLKFQRGSCCLKENGKWVLKDEVPLFVEDRNYIEQFINYE